MASSTPHDALFRSVFSRHDEAVAMLRSFLPEVVTAQLDWTRLQRVNAQFVDADLAGHRSDLIYEVPLGDQDLYIYVLFEHQSTVEPLMPFRLLRYMVRLWTDWLANHKGTKQLPPIVPIVLAHTERGWNAPIAMQDLYAISTEMRSALADYLPSFVFRLDDISRCTDAELEARQLEHLGRLALLLLRHGRDGHELPDRLTSWAALLRWIRDGPDGRESLTIAMRYVLLVSERRGIENLAAAFEKVVGEGGRELVMTLGEELISLGEARGRAEGKAEGRAEGKAEGRAEGMANGKAEAILRILGKRRIEVSRETEARIRACSDLTILDRWMDLVLDVRSADDFFLDH